MPPRKLKQLDVLAIKRRIWNGETREEIAQDFTVGLMQICLIGAGYRWPEIAWPDGSIGALSESRKIQIRQARARAKKHLRAAVRKELRSSD
jgi:hypothetical protein